MNNDFTINNELLEFFRMNTSITSLNIFKKEKTELIVSNELTHDSLLKNHKISDVIKLFYYKNSRSLIGDLDFEKLKNLGYYGDINTTLKPYSIVIFGAYHLRSDLICKLQQTYILKDIITKINNKEVKTLFDLEPYFEDYKDGFKDGFNNFENEQIRKYLIDFADKNDFIFKVFEYVTKEILFSHSWLGQTGFTCNYDIKNKTHNIVGGYENGKEKGFFYKAWTIIFSNNNLFTPLFDNYEKKLENKNTFPLVFINEEVYNCFLDYKKHIIDFYSDYSYLKKRLEDLKLIHYHTDNDFMKFLLNDLKFITQKNYYDYLYRYESKLKSLSKSRSEQRENNFNNVFERLL